MCDSYLIPSQKFLKLKNNIKTFKRNVFFAYFSQNTERKIQNEEFSEHDYYINVEKTPNVSEHTERLGHTIMSPNVVTRLFNKIP